MASFKLVEKNFGPAPPATGVAKSADPSGKAVRLSERRSDATIQSSIAGPSDQKQSIVCVKRSLEPSNMPSKHSELSLWVLSGLLGRLSE